MSGGNDKVDWIFENIDLEKYSQCNQLGVIGWYNQLSRRHLAWKWLEPDEGHLKNAVASILVAPLGPKAFMDKPILGGVGWPLVADLDVIALWEAGNKSSRFPPHLWTLYEKWCQELESSHELPVIPDELLDSYHSVLLKSGSSLESLRNVYVEVDLGASDEELLAGFKSWLQEKRNEMNSYGQHELRKKKFSSKDCKSWAEKQVLPYIDIQMLADLLNVKIPNHKIGDFLFSDDYDTDVGERIRKVTKPLSDYLMNSETLNQLQVSASIEAGEKAE